MSSKPIVYLAGPITGQTWGETTDWRQRFIRELHAECDVRSPLRGKEYLKALDVMPDATDMDALSTQHAIYLRDRNDVMCAQAVVANFLGSKIASIGTCFELAWCTAYSVPAIIIMEQADVHNHAFVRESAYVVVSSEDAAMHVLRILLNLKPARSEAKS